MMFIIFFIFLFDIDFQNVSVRDNFDIFSQKSINEILKCYLMMHSVEELSSRTSFRFQTGIFRQRRKQIYFPNFIFEAFIFKCILFSTNDYVRYTIISS